MITVGILADTHISNCTETFQSQTRKAFSGCDVIIHAGDLIDLSILSAFTGKILHAVQGNMCNAPTKQSLPREKLIELGGYSIGISHGDWPRATVEENVLNLFSDSDCIIFGHTHTPLCEKRGSVLFINPGSFQGSGSYESPATYAILLIDDNGLQAEIHSLPFAR